MQNTPFLLIICDGWGIATTARSNPISQAKLPVYNHLLKNYWVQVLQASGDSVGLPWGEMGNSEVGHLSLGAGKIIYQDLPRITKAISDHSFFQNAKFLQAFERVKQNDSTLHVAGLISDGGVHSHVEHAYALLESATNQGVKHIALHCFLDGRDVAYNSALGFIEDLEARIIKAKLPARIATLTGRYWAMDRDNRWDRTMAAYQAIFLSKAPKTFTDPKEAIRFYYKQEIYDEQIPPIVITPEMPVKSNDVMIFFNFRADRMRQLTTSVTLPDFNKFDRGEYLQNLLVVTMTEYEKALPAEIAFPPELVTNPLAKVLSDNGVRQLHVAETEKYAHVTFFLNGGREDSFPGEQRILVPSPPVCDYAEVPEMSAAEVTSRLMRELSSGQFEFTVVNYANPDMVAHTGNLKATIAAVEYLDTCFKRIIELVLSLSGVVMLTSDHGNAEILFDPQSGEINKEHSSNPVPCIIVGKGFVEEKPTVPDLSTYTPRGVLADVAPTILKIMGVPLPPEMTGRPLV
ncbi:MAG: phosphoglycerate mutase (2,3-diphosphoglycerate-independent) [Candidatus Jacksonbacteria bacterium RIFOXYC2_FULL_44_29]|nr:MAG: 2,3-bisphosphoglycerate-independent phosphoglycerate mutase [Parcubacteria group bacterium GW2011_GWA2_42_28]KKT55140.1 MAG: 2,3-bisphosphoglycerate-independent phosphoglycerate mutase [Parcubacteria group bacterium GW2011_GWC2_44_22]OGY75520.1 MAG: phosphoglycerate mutase (2,3-diphosphoglycerate-independent) [Candidatus Jacksonbacteria bacterium RIFOXYA2_FULL_43_12]OGY75818.1 MAG: phosphoglycerate mutase (2,3-diphosphoglycerate-independent) [Candidatus Jacksonbacteria bacterium RIFOXYB2